MGEFEEATNNIAQDLILNGEWEEGFKYYEKRLKRMVDQFRLYDELYGKPWEGKNEQRRFDELLIVAEQGYGDTIQFVRFLPELKKMGIKYSFFCQESLAGLLKSSNFIDEIKTCLIGSNKNILWCPLLSLPERLGITRKTLVGAKGYIKASKKHNAKWQRILKPEEDGILIGLHWQGNKKNEERTYSRGRSMAYKYFAELNNIKNARFIALQKGESLNDIDKDIGLRYADGQKLLSKSMCFEDTAAAIRCCDLVITTDNSIAHLTGSMGVKCYLLLSWVPEWRWGLTGKKTGWYNSTTLIRQERRGDWTE